MMHKVIIDTNVIISGVLYGGTPALILQGIQQNKFILCTSQNLHNEIYDKLIHKFFVDKTIAYDVGMLLESGVLYVPKKRVKFPQDQMDAYLLELAEESNAHYLITGDKKHLLPLKKWNNTRIISPKESIKLID